MPTIQNLYLYAAIPKIIWEILKKRVIPILEAS